MGEAEFLGIFMEMDRNTVVCFLNYGIMANHVAVLDLEVPLRKMGQSH